MKTAQDLKNLLQDIDRKSYPAYNPPGEAGSSAVTFFPSTMFRGIPSPLPPGSASSSGEAPPVFPPSLYDTVPKRIALQDHLLRLSKSRSSRFTSKPTAAAKAVLWP